jgi:prefoldin subunit 5
MEETAYEWENIKGMTNTAMLEREIAVLTNQIRRITKRLDYLHICKHQLATSSSTDQVQKELLQSSEP